MRRATAGNSSDTTCYALAAILANAVFFPGDTTYNSSEASYAYVQQQIQRPSCIVKPSSTAEVSSVVKILQSSSSAFAIKSGGHATNSGFSNIDGGVTLDLTSLNSVSIVEDGDLVTASVGGIGFFALQHGFGCDAVKNIEVVLASGEVINANWSSHQDLFVALKGGQSNFGIVTRWDIETIPQGKLWGGNIIYNYSTILEQLEAFTTWKSPDNFNQLSSVEQSHVYSSSVDEWIVSTAIFYAQPTSDPENLKNFTSIGSQLSNTIRISNVTDFANEVQAQSTPNLYTIFASTTFKISPTILAKVESLWQTSVKEISQIASITSSMTLQSIPAPPSNPTRKNSLGFEPSSTPQEDLVLLLITNFWDDPEVGVQVEDGTQAFIENVMRATKDEGLARDFVYENYAASGFQKPLETTGNLEAFQKVASKYDPANKILTYSFPQYHDDRYPASKPHGIKESNVNYESVDKCVVNGKEMYAWIVISDRHIPNVISQLFRNLLNR
ncbi:FAD binding domain-containing protein [Diaporthe amygdali]|uniref:FAD binding domain-containing protein n=1 Tax=Phomopsis amygdali TaxID=1214568 RepID=UPI0022FE55E5|nr:FAD binding domain-containing protein [Diaporthe amygdali]KAJ0120688.1 FAD binding domain-containing protein [Diaporthe amygdali]